MEIIHNNIQKNLAPLYLKYKRISFYKKNEHLNFGADLIKNDHSQNILNNLNLVRHANKKILMNNPYYGDFIVNEREFKKLIKNFYIR